MIYNLRNESISGRKRQNRQKITTIFCGNEKLLVFVKND
jgi:hypothetical protein